MEKHVIIVTLGDGVGVEDVRAAIVQGLPGVLNVETPGSYSLAELRDGTGFDRDARFVQV